MKKLWIIGALLAVIMFVMPAMAVTVPILAGVGTDGKNTQVGTADIVLSGDGSTLDITWTMFATNEWYIIDVHAAAQDGSTWTAPLVNKQGSPTLGNWPIYVPGLYQKAFGPLSLTVPAGIGCDDTFLVAVHTKIGRTLPDGTVQTFTGWTGDRNFGGKSWATYMVMQKDCSKDCIDIVSDAATMDGVINVAGPWDPYLTQGGSPFSFPLTAYWIWKNQGVTDPANGEIVELSKTFTIPGDSIISSSGSLDVTCDNGYELKVNNAFIGRAQLDANFRTASALTNDIVWWYDTYPPDPATTNGAGPYGWASVENWNIAGQLKTGTNTLQLTGVNEACAGEPDQYPYCVGTRPGSGGNCENPAGCKFSSGPARICYESAGVSIVPAP